MISLAQILVCMLIGGMVFFPSVVAPIVFKTMDEKTASQFLRRLFPRYYIFIIILSAAAFLLLVSAGMTNTALVMLVITVSTIWVRQWLVPRINADRDAELEGDMNAAPRFKRGHRLSVVINMLQLIAAVFTIYILNQS